MSQNNNSRSGLRRSNSSSLRRPFVQRQMSHEEPLMVLRKASSSPSIAHHSRKKAPITTGRVVLLVNDGDTAKNRDRSFSDDRSSTRVVPRPSSLRRSFRSFSSGSNMHQLPTYLEVDTNMDVKGKGTLIRAPVDFRNRDLPRAPSSCSSLPQRDTTAAVAPTGVPTNTIATAVKGGMKNGGCWIRLIGVLFLLLTILQLILIQIYLESYRNEKTNKLSGLEEERSSPKGALETLSLEALIPSSSISQLETLKGEELSWWSRPEAFGDENKIDIGRDDGSRRRTVLIIAATLVDHRYLAALWSHLECAATSANESDDRFIVVLALPDWSRPIVEPMLVEFSQRSDSAIQHHRYYRYYLTYDRQHVGLWCDVLEKLGLADTTTPSSSSRSSTVVVMMSDRVFSLKPGIVTSLLDKQRDRERTASSKSSLQMVGIASSFGLKGENNPILPYYVEDSVRAFLTPTSLETFWEHSCRIRPTHESFGINFIGTPNVTIMESTYQNYHERDLFRNKNKKLLNETSTLGLFSSHPTREWIQKHQKHNNNKRKTDPTKPWHAVENFDYWKSMVESDAFFPLASTERPRHVSMNLSKKAWLGWCTKGVVIIGNDDHDDITSKFQGWMNNKPAYLNLNNFYQPI